MDDELELVLDLKSIPWPSLPITTMVVDGTSYVQVDSLVLADVG